MKRSVKITIIIIGLLSIGASIYSYIKGNQDDISYFAIFIGIALIGTALATQTVKEQV